MKDLKLAEIIEDMNNTLGESNTTVSIYYNWITELKRDHTSDEQHSGHPETIEKNP